MKKACLISVLLAFLAGCSYKQDYSILWKFTNGYRIHCLPVVCAEKVYLGSDRLYCLNGSSGEMIWQFEAPGHVQHAPVVSDGYIYFQAGGTYCLDAETGRLIWEVWKGRWMDARPVAGNGFVYCYMGGAIHCLSSESGRTVWSYVPGSPQTGEVVHNAAPVVSGTNLCAVFNGVLYYLEGASGTLLWKRSLEDGCGSVQPEADEKTVYYSSGSCCCAIDGDSGRVVWRYPTGLPAIANAARPLAYGGNVYFTLDAVYCFHGQTGNLLWRYPLQKETAPGLTVPAVTCTTETGINLCFTSPLTRGRFPGFRCLFRRACPGVSWTVNTFILSVRTPRCIV